MSEPLSRDHRTPYDQEGFRCRLEWGRQGVRRAVERRDVVVVVDVLSFSTAVVTAMERGAIIYPCGLGDDPQSIALRVGGHVAVRRDEVPHRGQFSLSPQTYDRVEHGTRVVLPSPNGATCSRFGREAPHLLVGALVNAGATARAVNIILGSSNLDVTVVACGERWTEHTEDGSLRVALEDWLGAGAILSYLTHPKSPEARAAEASFISLRADIESVVWECGSGRELRSAGYDDDVRRAARVDIFDAIPEMRGDHLIHFG